MGVGAPKYIVKGVELVTAERVPECWAHYIVFKMESGVLQGEGGRAGE